MDEFQYILNRLSELTDSELKDLDFSSGLSALDSSDIENDDKKRIKVLFNSIQKELPIEHFGVKGMKWGVRRYQNKDGSLTPAGKKREAEESAKKTIFGTAKAFSVKTRDGSSIDAKPIPKPSVGKRILDSLMGTPTDQQMGHRGDANYTLNDSKGNKVGELSLISKKDGVAYVDWIEIDKKQRGKGYATDVLNSLLETAKDSGYSKVELNAVKKARPLYERVGFTYKDMSKVNIMKRINEFEFGCKHMEYDLTKLRHSSDELLHYGILGMKWGVRRTEAQLARARGKKSSDEDASDDYKKAHDKKSVKSMSDKELRDRLNRLQMEQQYSKLNPTTVSKGKKIANGLLKAGTTVATVTTTALTIYNNFDKIKKLVKG